MKKIAIISFRYEARDFNKYLPKTIKKYKTKTWSEVEKYAEDFNKSRIKEFDSIAKKVSENGISHILFSGNTIIVNDNIWDEEGYSDHLKRIKKLFGHCSLIMELRYFDEKIEQHYPPVDTGIICLEKGSEVGERIQQIFAEGSNMSKNYMLSTYKRFWAENLWEHRLKNIDGLRFLIWVCGEINFLRCPQKIGKDPIARLKFNDIVPDPLQDLKYDILFNPVHSPMGELHLVKRKLSYLSRNKRIAIQTTNIPSFQKKPFKRAFYCFKDGKEILPSEIETIENERWIMNIIQI